MKLQNKIFATLVSGMVLFSILPGCDDPNSSAIRPTTKPSAQAATNPPSDAMMDPKAVVAAYPVKPPSVLSIAGRDVAFPAAKLAVVGHGTSGYTLLLCSDDPPTAIDPGYAGNSYVLYMRPPIDRLNELDQWDYKPTDGDDSNSGIFLHGFREQLHPEDVHIVFQKAGDDMVISLSGHYLRTDTRNPAAPNERVMVNAMLWTGLPTESIQK